MPGPQVLQIGLGGVGAYWFGEIFARTVGLFAQNVSNAISQDGEAACDAVYANDLSACWQRVRSKYGIDVILTPDSQRGPTNENAKAELTHCNQSAYRQFRRCLNGEARDPADEWGQATSVPVKDDCEFWHRYDDNLCIGVALPRYGVSGGAVCKQTSTTRFAECVSRGGRQFVTTPLYGVSSGSIR
jgi:hypothetical protein